MTRHRTPSLLVLVSILIFSIGCSGNSPVMPPLTSGSYNSAGSASNADDPHRLWGNWEVVVDIENSTIEYAPLRSSDLHFNVVPLLMEGTFDSALTFANLNIDADNHSLSIDVSLEHPFPTLPHVAGFDVRGIFFTRGGSFNIISGNVIMTGPDEPRLVNADGYTRWWNPLEFFGPSVLGYVDGYYGVKKINAGFQNTLAGYKYFADGLGTLDTMADLDPHDRGVFRAGSKNTRSYRVEFGDIQTNFLVFNYAVDACWGPIPGYTLPGPPPVIPDDFPLSANCPEPYWIDVRETSNTLSATTLGGTIGTVNLEIDIYDWQAMDPLSSVPMEVSVVQVEAPIFGLGPSTATVIPGSGGDGHMSTYTASIAGGSGVKLDTVDLIVTATSSEGDYQNEITNFLGVGPLQAFFVYSAKVLDADLYSGWNWRYTKNLYPEEPNQGANLPDIAVYPDGGNVVAATVDQINYDPDNTGENHPDSINVWSNDYDTVSEPEFYHMPIEMLIDTGLWNDVNGITVADLGTRFFFTSSNIHDEFSDGETEPVYSFLTWLTHWYLGNEQAESWNTVFFSAGGYPRYYCTDPCNGVDAATDYIYSVYLYDVTNLAGPNPAPDPLRYIIMRWQPPYQPIEDDADWVRPNNVPPGNVGPGYVDRDQPYNHRLAVDDSTPMARFYILDSLNEIEVVDSDFSDEFFGWSHEGTVTVENLPPEVTGIVDIEVVQTRDLGTLRNHVAALCTYGLDQWRVWVFDFDEAQPLGSQAVTQWISDPYFGTPCSIDASDSPIEAHVLHQNGAVINVSVFRDYP